jgi:hypothetical protein
MLGLAFVACADPRVDELDRRVAELSARVTDLDGRLGANETRTSGVREDLTARVGDLDSRLAEIERRSTRAKAMGALTGRWTVHAEPLVNHGCLASGSPNPADYTWDVAAPDAAGTVRIAVGGATSFPTIDATVRDGVLDGLSTRADGSVATIVVQPVDDTLVGYRVFTPRGADDRCSMTWRVVATRTP